MQVLSALPTDIMCMQTMADHFDDVIGRRGREGHTFVPLRDK